MPDKTTTSELDSNIIFKFQRLVEKAHWELDFSNFCERGGFRPNVDDSYTQSKWFDFQNLKTFLVKFDSDTLARILNVEVKPLQFNSEDKYKLKLKQGKLLGYVLVSNHNFLVEDVSSGTIVLLDTAKLYQKPDSLRLLKAALPYYPDAEIESVYL